MQAALQRYRDALPASLLPPLALFSPLRLSSVLACVLKDSFTLDLAELGPKVWGGFKSSGSSVGMQCDSTLKWRSQRPGRGQSVDLKTAHMLSESR